MNDKIIEKVKEFVEREFDKPTAYFKGVYESHFKPVVKYGLELVEKQNADKEIIEISAWLHDIGSIMGDHQNHHISSSNIAEKLLRELDCPEDKIEQVKHCILAHRGSVQIKRKTKEAQIIADADAMSHFDVIDAFLEKGYGTKASGYGDAETKEDAKKVILDKLERSYAKLSDNSKPLIKDKLEEARKILK